MPQPRMRLEDFKKAEEALLTGLDFLIDDPEMETEFYRQLAGHMMGLNQTQKAADFKKELKKLKTNMNELQTHYPPTSSYF